MVSLATFLPELAPKKTFYLRGLAMQVFIHEQEQGMSARFQVVDGSNE